MMKLLRWFTLAILPMMMVMGCSQDEKLNIMADITAVHCADESVLLSVSIHDQNIDIYASPAADVSNIQLSFDISKGATILPDPATVTDYSTPREFVVTSEDQNWTKHYTVRVFFPELPTKFGFENWEKHSVKDYRVPYEPFQGDQKLYIWACANAAFSFVAGKSDYTTYPTQPTTDAYEGEYAAKLVTKLTGKWDQPIAAGNLFIGQFDSSQKDAQESTLFGLPFTKKPLRFKGAFSYVSGGLTLGTETREPSIDRCSMKAILFKTSADLKNLNGYQINQDLPCIVARAEMPLDYECDTKGQYKLFDFEFKYFQELDMQLLKQGGYSLAVFFSASANGADYDGADGSTLCVDAVEIVCE